MRQGDRSRFLFKTYGSSATVTFNDVTKFGGFIATAVATHTIPTPIKGLAGYEALFVNNSSASLTIACTNGFAQSGDSITVATEKSAKLTCVPDGSTGYIWAVEVADNAVGTMTFGTEPVAVSSSTSGTAGDAATASRSNHGHDLGTHAHTGATNGGQVSTASVSDFVDWTAYTPTVVWNDAAPASVTAVYKYRRIGRSIRVHFDVLSADGDGKIITSITLPATLSPADIDTLNYGGGVHAQDMGGSPAYTTLQVYVDAADGTEGNRLIKFRNPVTCTNSQGFRTSGWVEYEIPAA